MARIRSLKPEIWLSPQVMNLSHSARLLFVGLITQADDEGRGTADARKLKAAVFPGDDVTAADVRRMLDECAGQGLVEVYSAQNHGLIYALPSWKSHQSIDRPRKSAYPSPTPRRALAEDSSGIGGDRSGSEGKGGERTSGARAGDPPPPPQPAAARWDDAQRMDGFAELVACYPKRDMPHGLLDEREYQARLDDGIAHGAMLEGAQRFAKFVAAGGVSAPRYVMAIRNFLAIPNRHWLQPWDPPKSQNALDQTIAAGQAFLAETAQ